MHSMENKRFACQPSVYHQSVNTRITCVISHNDLLLVLQAIVAVRTTSVSVCILQFIKLVLL